MHTFFRQYLAIAAALLVLTNINGCDSHKKNNNNSSSVATSSSSQSSSLLAPASAEDFGKVQVQFPPNGSHVRSDKITVRGSVLEADNVTSLSVNGDAIDVADLENWQLEVTLAMGSNDILVEATLDDASTLNQTLTVYRDETTLNKARDIVLDSTTDTLYALDRTQNTIFIVDQQTQKATQFSPTINGSDPNLLDHACCMVLDADNNRMIVGQKSDNSLLAIDLTSGAQSPLTFTGAENYTLLNQPTALTLVGQDLYVSDIEEVNIDDKLSRVPPTGSDDVTLETVIIYHVDLNSMSFNAVQSYESAADWVPVGGTMSMTHSASGDVLYVADLLYSTGIYKLDTVTGEITPISYYDTKGASINLSGYIDLVFQPSSSNIILSAQNNIFRLTPTTGRTILLSGDSYPENQPIDFVRVSQITLSSTGEHLLAFDDSNAAFISVDAEIGTRKILGDSASSPENNFVTISDIIFDDRNQQLFLLDSAIASIYTLNTSTQTKTRIASAKDFPEKNPLLFPAKGFIDGFGDLIVMDTLSSSNTRIVKYVADENNVYTPAIVKALNARVVDLVYDRESNAAFLALYFNSGSYLISKLALDEDYSAETFSVNSTENPDIPFSTIRGIALDSSESRLLISDSGVNAILSSKLSSSGEREYFSGYTTSAENNDAVELNQPREIVIDPASQQAFVIDGSQSAIIAVNLSDGSKSLWLDYSDLAQQGLTNPKALEIHPFFHYLWVFDEQSHQLLAIDIATKQIVKLSR